MNHDQIFAFTLFSLGLLSIAGGYLDWDWYMNWRNSRWFVNLIGRKAARVFYIVIGFVFSVIGVLAMFGLIVID